MERSRSKRGYYYDQDHETETQGRPKQRYNSHHQYSNPSRHHHRGGGGSVSRPSKAQDPPTMITTTYRILCHDLKAGGVVGKSGSIIKSIRQHTGAWINVHELAPGDEERIIEISDTRRRDPDGRMPVFSPAQEALFLIHDRILESEGGFAYGGGDEEEEFGLRGSGGNRAVTRLVVSRMNVGCLLGKGGKIIEQMRMETKTQIRVLPRDNTLPSCITMSDEIVQVVGDMNAVKKAIADISSRLRESQHRDRSHLHGRLQSPADDDFLPPMNSTGQRLSHDVPPLESRASLGSMRSSSYNARSSGYAVESRSAPMADNSQPFYGEDLVFRILCPATKVDSIVGEPNGIIGLLRNEVGVDVRVADLVVGSDEQIVIISSQEGPDDELFPAQEALLHIQTRTTDLIPDKENIITTRLLVSSSEIKCFEGRDGTLSDFRRLAGVDIQILPREELPLCVTRNDEILQIVGGIRAAREALVEVTSRLRGYLYGEFGPRDAPLSSFSVSGPMEMTSQNNSTLAPSVLPKATGVPGSEMGKQNESDWRNEAPSRLNRIAMPLVTRNILEVVLPEYAVPKLVTKSRNKLAQISELSGANVKVVDDRPEVIQLSGTQEQVERAQSLLQGFILSIQEE